jgi:hypothetical protein
VLDLAPSYQEKGRQARSQIGGLLFYLYVPVLFAYLYYTIQPVYVPLPSCCICATHYTINDSWVFDSINATCSTNQYHFPQRARSLSSSAYLERVLTPGACACQVLRVVRAEQARRRLFQVRSSPQSLLVGQGSANVSDMAFVQSTGLPTVDSARPVGVSTEHRLLGSCAGRLLLIGLH